MSTFLLKLVLSPLLIGGVSWAGLRWGPAVSGWLVGLPLTSGPVVLFLALDQGRSFAATSSQAIMMGIISSALFCLVYSRLARIWTWVPSLLAGWVATILSTVILNEVAIPLLPAFVLVIVALLVLLRLMPTGPARNSANNSLVVAPRWEIPLRMILATGFVLVLTALAALLGPHLSGLLAPLPIFASILGVFTHKFTGGGAAGLLLRGVVLGLFSFAAFFLIVAALMEPAGILAAFAAATVTALLIHSATHRILESAEENP